MLLCSYGERRADLEGKTLRSHLGIKGSVALRARLKGKDQTVVGAVQWEREVWEQAALVLHKDRRHSAGVL